MDTDCKKMRPTNHLNIHITYSPPQRISVTKISFRSLLRENLTITLLTSPYCIFSSRKISKLVDPQFVKYERTYYCDFRSFEDFKNEIIPQMIKFSFKSEKIFDFEMHKIEVHRFQEDCGTPDVALYASYNRTDFKTFKYFPTSHRNKHHIIGDGVITCLYEGNWDKEPPIFEPII